MYVDIKEKLEENKILKAENFELKKKLFIIMRELPTMKDPKGNDFTEDVGAWFTLQMTFTSTARRGSVYSMISV